jgi:hypothetical protein
MDQNYDWFRKYIWGEETPAGSEAVTIESGRAIALRQVGARHFTVFGRSLSEVHKRKIAKIWTGREDQRAHPGLSDCGSGASRNECYRRPLTRIFSRRTRW